MKRIKSDSSDKLWVTSEIKRLISKRQVAWNSGNKIMFRLNRNKVNTLCKRARSRFYNSNVANCFESNPHKWWSNIKNIAGLGATKNVSIILYNVQSYSVPALANLFNDKFVAVGSTLPPFSWTPIAVDDVPSDFYISIDEVEKALISVKSHSAAGPERFLPGSSVRTLPPYPAHWHPFSMLLFKKETSRRCGNPPMCLLCQNRYLP
jgi:hypothetical protein